MLQNALSIFSFIFCASLGKSKITRDQEIKSAYYVPWTWYSEHGRGKTGVSNTFIKPNLRLKSTPV